MHDYTAGVGIATDRPQERIAREAGHIAGHRLDRGGGVVEVLIVPAPAEQSDDAVVPEVVLHGEHPGGRLVAIPQPQPVFERGLHTHARRIRHRLNADVGQPGEGITHTARRFLAGKRIVVIAPEDAIVVVAVSRLRPGRMDVHPARAATVALVALLGIQNGQPMTPEQARPGRFLHELTEIEVVRGSRSQLFAEKFVPDMAVLSESAVRDEDGPPEIRIGDHAGLSSAGVERRQERVGVTTHPVRAEVHGGNDVPFLVLGGRGKLEEEVSPHLLFQEEAAHLRIGVGAGRLTQWVGMARDDREIQHVGRRIEARHGGRPPIRPVELLGADIPHKLILPDSISHEDQRAARRRNRARRRNAPRRRGMGTRGAGRLPAEIAVKRRPGTGPIFGHLDRFRLKTDNRFLPRPPRAGDCGPVLVLKLKVPVTLLFLPQRVDAQGEVSGEALVVIEGRTTFVKTADLQLDRAGRAVEARHLCR